MNKILAIDIGGTSIKYGVIDTEGTIIFTAKQKIEVNDVYIFTNDIIELARNIQKNHEIIGVAFSTPGVPDQKKLTISGISAVPCIHIDGWLEKVKTELNLPISIANDGNCSLLAELWLGKAQGKKNAIGVAIGSGIGGSVYTNGKLNTGIELCGGEFGYLLTKDSEGNIVNVSSRISTTSLVTRVKKVYDVEDGEQVFKLYDNRETSVVKEVDSYFDDLAMFIYNIHYSFEPEIILLGGGISSRPDLITQIETRFNKFGNLVGQEFIKFKVDVCKFSNDSNLLGAVYNFMVVNK